MKNIIKSLVVVVAVAAVASVATYAVFSDTETSAGNTFTAGTLDLVLGGTVQSDPVNLTNMKPGDSTAVTFSMQNVGSIPGDVSFSVTYVSADGAGTSEFTADMSDDDFAKGLLITDPVNFSQTGLSSSNIYNTLLAGFGWRDGVLTNVSLYDLKASGDIPMADPLNGGDIATMSMTIQLDPSAGNPFQADGITGYFNGTLTQAP